MRGLTKSWVGQNQLSSFHNIYSKYWSYRSGLSDGDSGLHVEE